MTTSTPDRAQLLAKLAGAATFHEQADLVGQLDALDREAARTAALGREVDWADTAISEAMTPVLSRTARASSASDWLMLEEDPAATDHTAMVAQAALWYGRVPDFVKADADEFTVQATGQARKLASGAGAEGAVRVFVDYAAFLRAQAASGLDQIEQTTAPDGVTEKPTPLPPDTFDNFQPPVNDLNAPYVGTETSSRAPAIQMAVGEGGNSSPEVPGGHSETGVMTGPGAEPSLTGSPTSNSSPEGEGGHSDTSAIPTQGGPGNVVEEPPPSDPAPMPPAPDASQPVADPGRRQAASGLPMIQQTTDTHDAPAATPLPTSVAFPWTMDEPVEADGMTGDAQYDQGGEGPARHQSTAAVKTADTYTQPPQLVQPNIATTPEANPPRTPAEAGSGAADARAGEQPSFGDAHAAPEYTQGYTSAAPAAGPQNVPVSMGGDNGQFLSRRLSTRQEMAHPDFQRGYKYAARWREGTALVRPGTPELEAGIYAGFTDRPEHRGAWLAAHARLAEREPKLAVRIRQHRRFTHKIAARQALPTDGTYLHVQAATGMDLDTTNPTTSPSPTGDTPMSGPGKPGPLAGGDNPAAPGGPAPYNGAEPYGAPVVPPLPSVPQGTPVTLPDNGMTAPIRAGEGMNHITSSQTPSLSATTAAFRRRVQAGLIHDRKGS